jgi:parallel beta-helix repeat protein/predicted outer membrane repeat protein
MYRTLIGFFAGMLAAAIVSAQTTIPGGYVSGTWTAAGSPYLIEGNITIHEDSSLTIDGPVEVFFQDYYGLTVNGFLETLGNQLEWICFFPANTSTGWAGITLYEAVDTSRFSYCLIESVMNASGIHCWDSNISLDHCSIMHNQASDGGGILLVSSTVTATNCTIEENVVSGFGGGVFSGFGGMLTLSNCTITSNESGSRGGGIYSSGPELNLSGCTIQNNTADEKGGGIYIDASLCNLTDCTVESNSGGVHAITNHGGGGLFARYADLTVTGGAFSENSSEGNGGGICLTGCSLDLSGCAFTGNAHDGTGAQYDGGGAMFAENVDLAILGCTFDENETNQSSGGGMCILNSPSAVIDDCNLNQNTSNFMGGGIFCQESSGVIISNCYFEDNSANYSTGGAMNILDADDLTVTGSTFCENSAFYGAAAMDLGGVTNSTISHCTICSNICEDAGGISISSTCTNVTVINTIAALNVGPGIDNGHGSTSIMYSDFYENLGGDVVDIIPPGLGELTQVNINDDSCDVYQNIFLYPLFADTTGGDYQIT